MVTKVTMKQLREEADSVKLKKGDRVVFLPMGGIWSSLQWMTGVIIKKNKDPMWRYDVEIDLPHLLYPDSALMRKNDYVTCVGPTAVVHIKQIRKEDVPKLNRGLGPDSISPKMSKLVALRRLWKEIWKMSWKNFEDARKHLEKFPDGDQYGWFKGQVEKGPDELSFAQKKLDGFTEQIKKLTKRGETEPPEYTSSS